MGGWEIEGESGWVGGRGGGWVDGWAGGRAGGREGGRVGGRGTMVGVVASSLPGPSGNVEYFLWLSRGSQEISDSSLDLAIEKGPQ